MKTFLKAAWIFVVAVVVVGGSGYFWVSRDTAPIHPALAEADLPPVIPVRHFWANTASEWNYDVSGDGKFITHWAVRGTKEVVLLKDSETMSEIAVLDDVWSSFWSTTDDNLYMISGNERLWRIDPTSPDKEAWVDVTPRGFSNWNTNMDVPVEDGLWIVTSRDRNPAYADVYTTNQNGGDKRLFVENDGKTLGWFFDHDQVPLLRFDRGDNDETLLLIRDNEDGTEWRELVTLDPFETFWVLNTAKDAKSVMAMSSRGRDKAALVRFDLSTATEEVLAADPDIDLSRTFDLQSWDEEIDLVRPHSNSSSPIPLTERGKVLARLISEYGESVYIDRLRAAGPGRFVTATLSPDAKSYIYVLFDLEEETQRQLGEYSFRQWHLDKLVPTEEVKVPARDGLEIPALLLRPRGVTGPVPMVVEVHGGPASHVDWEYNHFRQFLVNRGYAVLSVNFRGSTGYGRDFQAKAFKQFGRAMQTDLYDAANWAVEQGIADPDRIAVMGGSYGGYASAMAATDPDSPFSVAVIEHAVMDLEYQMRNNPFAWGLNTVYMERYFGTLDNEEDLAAMQEYTPVNRVEDLSMPVLVVAGKRDRIVGFEQSEEFLRKARAAGHEPQELIFEDEGHGIDRWQNSVRHARVVEDFLAEHLGGRSGGWDYIELAADWLDRF